VKIKKKYKVSTKKTLSYMQYIGITQGLFLWDNTKDPVLRGLRFKGCYYTNK